MRKLSDRQVDEWLDPNYLKDHVPGFTTSMNNSKVVAAMCHDPSKFTKRSYEGWRHIGNIPTAVVTMLYQIYTPEELCADGGKILIDFVKRNHQYYGVNKV